MKLERVNENQIRCTITKEDLELRQLKLSEIAYGSKKTKMLFKDVMQQASYELGFDADNIPLMIEAIPMSTGCVVFIITKVDNPEELDTRFSRFAPSVIENNNVDIDDDNEEEDDVQVLDAKIEIVAGDALKEFIDSVASGNGESIYELFKKISAKAHEENRNRKDGILEPDKLSGSRIYCFDDLDAVAKASRVLLPFFSGNSSLYKDPKEGLYYLLLEKGDYNAKEFLKVSNLMLEYGSYLKTSTPVVAYIKEHFKLMIEHDAIAGMSQF